MTSMAGPKKSPPVLENKKARRNYEILETIEAGIVLLGTEVKSLRNGRADIGDAYVVPKGESLTVVNMKIEPYVNAGAFNHEESRTRGLLLHKKEIRKLSSQIREKRLTLVVLKLYFNNQGKVKLLLGLGKGKKTVDRREDEKKAQAQKEIARAMKEANR
jgi:SsrA-binding protein